MHFCRATILALVEIARLAAAATPPSYHDSLEARNVKSRDPGLGMMIRDYVEFEDPIFARDLDHRIYARDILSGKYFRRDVESERLVKRVVSDQEVKMWIKRFEEPAMRSKEDLKHLEDAYGEGGVLKGTHQSKIRADEVLEIMSGYKTNPVMAFLNDPGNKAEVNDVIRRLKSEGRDAEANRIKKAREDFINNENATWKKILAIRAKKKQEKSAQGPSGGSGSKSEESGASSSKSKGSARKGSGLKKGFLGRRNVQVF